MERERLLTPKQRANFVLKFIRAMIQRRRRETQGHQLQATPKGGAQAETLKDIDRILSRATKAAFKKAGLDIKNDEDWKILLPFLAWAIFDKEPGRSITWTKQELGRLRDDAARLRAKTSLTELKCCEILIKEDHYNEKGVTAVTLRRRLQQAKKLSL